ncbi:hypothetical protein LMG23992_02691 [Cupriavidus laharis]|uniref:Uncharacterized protein n=1 Tax=Cupriavidus laharis TaxID=151654 RepID=A0ABM8X2Z9_9BURK|nr:hypothetical protein [Cupriavidus laharis]CAG9174279.1 hypothetical protein LMG23992_02691 [Cupriavidus laharis]
MAERSNRFTLDLLLCLVVRAGVDPRIGLANPRAVVPVCARAKA